jgi:hypothetical protein
VSRAESAALKAGSIIQALVPDPTDVIALWMAFGGTIAQGKEELREKGYNSGFSQGLAASVFEYEYSWVKDELVDKHIDPNPWAGMAGYEGVRERAFNQGAIAGFQLGEKLPSKLRARLRNDAIEAMRSNGQRWNGIFDEAFVNSAGTALMPTVREYFAKKEELRKAEERRADVERMRNRVYWGTLK